MTNNKPRMQATSGTVGAAAFLLARRLMQRLVAWRKLSPEDAQLIVAEASRDAQHLEGVDQKQVEALLQATMSNGDTRLQ